MVEVRPPSPSPFRGTKLGISEKGGRLSADCGTVMEDMEIREEENKGFNY